MCGACRAAEHAAAITEILTHDLHLSQVEIDEFWSFVREPKGAVEQPNEGERWGCLVQDRDSRFVAACATGPVSEGLTCWFSDGWQSYRNILVQAYRQPLMTGKRGRPRLVVPETVSLTQTIKQRDKHGHLLSVEIRTALGESLEPAGTVHVERLNGALRDRLNALTRKTHAFAKRDATWDALVGLQLFDHNFQRAHRALRLPVAESGVPRYHYRSPAMALGLTDHRWSFVALLTTRVPATS